MSRARWVGLFLAGLALVFFPFAADNFELPRLCALGLAAAWLLRAAPVVSATQLRLLAAWAALALLGTVTSQSPAMSLPALLAALTFAAGALVTSEFEVAPLLWAVWPIAGYACLQRLGLDPLAWSQQATWCGEPRPASTLGHPAQLAGWLAMVLPLALDQALLHRRARRAFALATAALVVATLGLTLARAGWLAAAAGTVAWALMFRGPARRRLLLSTAAASAGALALAFSVTSLRVRLEFFFVAPTRLQLWDTALSAWRAQPGLGLGLDTFVLASQRFRSEEAWRLEWGATPQHAHSLVPQVAATLGTVGLVVLALAAFALGRAAWRCGQSAAVPAGVVGASVAFVVGAALTLQGVAVTALGLACLAQLVRGVEPLRSLERARPLLCAAVSGVTVLTGLSLAASVAGRQALDRPAEQAARALGWAQRLEPLSALWPALEGQHFEVEARGGARADWARALRAYQRARAVEPNLAQYAANVGRVAAATGERAMADEAFGTALRQAPLDARVRLDAAEAFLQLGDAARAEAELTVVLTTWPAWGPPWWALANLRARQGREVEERAALEAGLRAEWFDWPEGANATRARLAAVLTKEGDLPAAERLLTQVTVAPGDICGAPRQMK